MERPGIAEIHVAQGTYHPAGPGGNRQESFELIDGLVLRGGYAGVQNADPGIRNLTLYPTILSGDLNQNDNGESLYYQDNSYHVVTGKMLSSDTLTGRLHH